MLQILACSFISITKEKKERYIQICGSYRYWKEGGKNSRSKHVVLGHLKGAARIFFGADAASHFFFFFFVHCKEGAQTYYESCASFCGAIVPYYASFLGHADY